jgi:nicotinamide mononucleotide adenylyltransferase
LTDDLKRGSIIKKPKSVKNYINGPDFYLALVAYNEKLKIAEDGVKPKIPRYVGECILKIAQKLSTKFNFVSYSFREEMVSDAIEKMVEKVEKYDVGYNKLNPNPLGYFTQIAWNVFLQRIEKEKKENYIKHKNFERHFSTEIHNMEEMFNNEEHKKVIDDFEAPKTTKSNNYAKHANLDYSKNRSRHKKKEENDTE